MMAKSTLADNVLVNSQNSFGNPLSEANLNSLYDRIRHLLTDKHRKYLDNIKNGEGEIDPMIELEMNLRLVSVLAQNAVDWSLRDGKVPRDVSTLLSEVRQSASAIEEIRRKRDGVVKEEEAEEAVFNPLKDTAYGRIKSLRPTDSEKMVS